MPKALSRDTQSIASILRSFRGEVLPYRHILESLSESVPFELGTVVSSLPRGGLQVVQPAKLPHGFTRSYSREHHLLDRPAWQAIIRGQVLCADDVWSDADFESSRYFAEFLSGYGFRFVAVVPLTAPVMDGYGGVLELFRTADQGPFLEHDLRRLRELAPQLDEAITRLRRARRASSKSRVLSRSRPAVRQFIFDSELRPKLPASDFNALDARLRDRMMEHARQRFGHLNGKEAAADRLSLPDSNNDFWNFRVVSHRTYPALGDGPFIFFCLQPDCADWSLLRSSDLPADAEMARLVPAIRFMQEHYQRGPTLTEIARTAHLSPFHFHRRFTELLGITPKHLMLDCQIESAKSQLVARDRE
ncbi:MAG: AraC family transcriptional regulator, partial [Tepidisphaeraceae bacterium]